METAAPAGMARHKHVRVIAAVIAGAVVAGAYAFANLIPKSTLGIGGEGRLTVYLSYGCPTVCGTETLWYDEDLRTGALLGWGTDDRKFYASCKAVNAIFATLAAIGVGMLAMKLEFEPRLSLRGLLLLVALVGLFTRSARHFTVFVPDRYMNGGGIHYGLKQLMTGCVFIPLLLGMVGAIYAIGRLIQLLFRRKSAETSQPTAPFTAASTIESGES